MPREPSPEVLARLHRAAAAARAAEEMRLAGILRAIAGCRDRAARLRQTLVAPPTAPAGAADLAATMRWQARLAAEARAETARAEALATEAEAARRRLARAFGRERAVAELMERAHHAHRRRLERQAENAAAARPAASQSPSPESDPGGTSAGSPGMA